MICTFCGSENRQENRFCGMCGVRLDRRQKERRNGQSGSLKCAACGHSNDSGYKFCGMCGTRVERRVQERRRSEVSGRLVGGESQEKAVALANAKVPSPQVALASRSSVQTRDASPVVDVPKRTERTQPATVSRSQEQRVATIGGPSFLGLSSEPQSEGQYLLDDDSSSRSGLRKLVLLAVLAAIIGLVYAQWRANTAANPKSPEPPKRQPASVPRPQGNNLQPKIDTQEKESVKEASSQNVTNKKVDRQETPQAVAAAELAKPPQKEQQQDDNATTAEDTATEARTVDSKVGRQSELRKSKAVPMMREQPSIALVKAQRYLQGRGVPQNCEQGLLYLKAATRENDPNAAVQMAALYASGHCVQQNRVKAYQWFSSAHDLKPENQWIAKNMDQLWAQMTQQERRQFQ